jgi:hypothetical protein
MLEHLPGNDAALGVGTERKRNLEILNRQAPVAAIDGVERAPEQRSGTEDRAHRQQPHDPDHPLDGGILEAVPERGRLIRQLACRG